MKTKFLNRIALALLLLAVASCKAPKSITMAKPKPVSIGKLIKNIEENAFDYTTLDIKRISVNYESPDEKVSFRGSIKLLKDDHILVSMSKINIPVAKLLLTPDSLKLINYMEKSFTAKDFSDLSMMINVDIDFYTVQSVLANNVFSFKEYQDDKYLKDFVSYVDSNYYIIQSFKNRKLEKIENKGKEEKIDRYLKKVNEEDFIVQYLYIDPATFKITRIVFDDITNSKNLTIRFSDFVAVDNKLYPANLNIDYQGPGDYLKIKIKLSKFSTDYNSEISFNVPDKYNRIQ